MNPRLPNMLPQVGVYTLIIHLPANIRLKVGKLGEHQFPRGYYAYTGSALGLGASNLRKRVLRHLQKKKNKFWHIDYLLAPKDIVVIAIIAAQTNKRMECAINRHLKNEMTARIPVLGFGASDCKENCGSHLLFFPDIIEEQHLIQKVVKCTRLASKEIFVVKQTATHNYRCRSLRWSGKPRFSFTVQVPCPQAYILHLLRRQWRFRPIARNGHYFH